MNYIGYKTKAFEVIKETPIEYQKGSHKKYIVQCLKCGTTFIRTIQNINKFQGTGCLTCTPRYSKNSKDNDWHLYMHYKNHAHSKNRIFNITYEEFKKIVHSDCYYCGSKPSYFRSMIRYSKNSSLQELNGVDRIDSNKGYTKDNCVPCCKICNQMKSNIDIGTFLTQISKIYNFKNVQRLSREGVDSSESKQSDSEKNMI